MKFRILTALAVAGTIALAAVGPALAINPPTLDQHHECAATNCNLSSQVLYPVWNSQQGLQANSPVAMAQRFTAGISGPLSKVELYLEILDNGTPVPFDVSIVSTIGGVPQPASPLATETVTPTAGTAPWGAIGNPAWIPVTFSTPATVTAGTLYAIVVGWQLPASSWLMWEVDASWGTSGYTGYTNYDGALGEAMVGTHVLSAYNWYDVFQVTTINDSQTGNADFAFRTYVGAATPTPTPTPTPSPRLTQKPTQPPTDAVVAAEPGQPSSGLPLLVLAIAGLAGLAVLLTPGRTRFFSRR